MIGRQIVERARNQLFHLDGCESNGVQTQCAVVAAAEALAWVENFPLKSFFINFGVFFVVVVFFAFACIPCKPLRRRTSIKHIHISLSSGMFNIKR